MKVYLHVFLTLALGEGDWSASGPGRFMLMEIDPDIHLKKIAWAPEPVLVRW
jgi:hypothetical protein